MRCRIALSIYRHKSSKIQISTRGTDNPVCSHFYCTRTNYTVRICTDNAYARQDVVGNGIIAVWSCVTIFDDGKFLLCYIRGRKDILQISTIKWAVRAYHDNCFCVV